jgi:hypothetical protein
MAHDDSIFLEGMQFFAHIVYMIVMYIVRRTLNSILHRIPLKRRHLTLLLHNNAHCTTVFVRIKAARLSVALGPR